MANPLFEVHVLNDQGKERARVIAETFEQAFEKLSALTPTTPTNVREFAIVRTKLEEACFYAKKAMAMLPENQDLTAKVV
jgi:hypothetical protein